jgi:hypothetical protein
MPPVNTLRINFVSERASKRQAAAAAADVRLTSTPINKNKGDAPLTARGLIATAASDRQRD